MPVVFARGDLVELVGLSTEALVGVGARVLGPIDAEKGRYPVQVLEGESKGKKIKVKPVNMRAR